MRELKFDLDVASNALLCPNPSEWFVKSYIQPDVANNFRTIPGVKEATKVSKNTFKNLIKAAGCSWNATDTTLDAEDIDVCKFDVMVQVCQYDLESTFCSKKMAAGDANWNESEFFAHYWSELQEAVAEELQLIRCNGNSSITGTSESDLTLKVCDGYLVKLEAASGATENTAFTASTFTKENIVGAIGGTVALLPEAVISREADLRIYMSAGNAFKYQLATLGMNHDFNYTGTLPLSFAGYNISVQPGMNNDYIVVGSKDSFVYSFDGSGDEKALKIVNMMDSTAEPIIRTRVGLKAGFHILDAGSEVAYVKVGA
jgi:hypothetical protein